MTDHFFTVDVEEHFQVSAFDNVVARADWPSMSRRLDRNIPILLDLLERNSAKGTFFVLGWVARHEPDIVRKIARAGHEIASHGYWHERVHTLTPAGFREDVRSSRAALEDLTGQPVIGYRAPSFSIGHGCEWAFDVLIEEGFRYDSSVFPIRRKGYGYAGAPKTSYVMRRGGGALLEFPLATVQVAGLTLPAAGGGYLRQFPFWLIRRAFTKAGERRESATFYIHPWEIDPDQPRLPVGPVTRVRHYRALGKTLGRIERLLREFTFTSIASTLDGGSELHSPNIASGASAR